MTEQSHLISVCIAIRNQAKLVGNTLESIFGQVLPEGYALEVIVTDDGSDDDTAAVVNGFPVTYLYRENHEYHNGVFAKNSSLRHAHGDVIIQQSADVVHSTDDVIASLLGPLPRSRATFARA